MSAFHLSVRPSTRNVSVTIERFFTKFDIWVFLKKYVVQVQVLLKSVKNDKYFAWRPIYIFWLYLTQLFLKLEKFQINVGKNSRHILRLIHFCFLQWCRLWDNIEKTLYSRQTTCDNKIRCMRMAFWIPKATNTHSEFVIFIAIPLQQQLHECASILV